MRPGLCGNRFSEQVGAGCSVSCSMAEVGFGCPLCYDSRPFFTLRFSMARYVALNKSDHRESGLLATGNSHALTQAVVPVVVEELHQVIPTMPLAFVRASEDSAYELVALQSLQPGVNVYVHTNGRWIGGYRPAWYRAHPFRLVRDESGTRRIVCVDEESESFQKEAGPDATRLFDADGEPAQKTRDLLAFLEKLEQSREITQALVNHLEEAGLIVPWKISAS